MAAEDSSNTLGATSAPPGTSNYASAGVFNNPGATQTTTQDGLSPSTSGTDANDATITLAAGAGLEGGGDFTTNQAEAETITFNLPNVGTAGIYGSLTQVIESITVDAQGRVTSVIAGAPPPVPFDDGLSAGSNALPQQTASEDPIEETITLMVADNYVINEVDATAGGILDSANIGDPVGIGTATVTIPVTIPGTTTPTDPIGDASVTTMITSMNTETGEIEMETVTPLETRTFLPFYTAIFDNPNRQTAAGVELSSFTASTEAITNGGRILVTNPFGAGRPDKYGYFALQTNDGLNGQGDPRAYGFAFGTFEVQIDVFATRTMFGRTFNIYEFPTRGNIDLTITF